MSIRQQTKRTSEQWLALFSAHAQSGQPAAVFCREQGVCPKYFSLRRRQLSSAGGVGLVAAAVGAPSTSVKAVTPRFVRVKVATPAREVAPVWPPFTMSVSGVTVTCTAEVSSQRVLALIDALRA